MGDWSEFFSYIKGKRKNQMSCWQKWGMRGHHIQLKRAELHEFIHSFNSHLLSAYYVPVTILGTEDAAMNKKGGKNNPAYVEPSGRRRAHANEMHVHLGWWCSGGQPGEQQSCLWHLLWLQKLHLMTRHKQFPTAGRLSKQLFPRVLPAPPGLWRPLPHRTAMLLSLSLSLSLILPHVELLFVGSFPEPLVKLRETEAKKT